MKFEKIVKTISAWAAGLAVFFLASGYYLSAKGFVSDGQGGFVLMRQAQAKPAVDESSIKAMALPQRPVLGNADAPVTLYEYSSFGCFHCADFHLKTLPKLKKDYIEKGLLKVMFVDFPLDKKSMRASLVSRCVAPEKYHSFLDLVFRKQRDWSLSSRYETVLSQYAALSGLSNEDLEKCLADNEKSANQIMADRQNAIESLGIQGTPSFLIVNRTDREVLYGVPSYDDLRQLLDAKLGIEQKK